jgi:acetoacetyl-CoA reductase
MMPPFNTVYTMQLEIVEQWYRSCNSTMHTLARIADYSQDIAQELIRQPRTRQPGTAALAAGEQTIPVKTGTAVVTGGTGGIGTEICRRLAGDGNRIIATCIAAEREQAAQWQIQLEKEGCEVEILVCDVADYESCKTFARLVEGRYGSVQVLVNAAGITRDAMLRKMTPEKWRAVIDTNLDSVFNVTRNFINGMLKNSYGRIINISSVNGQKGQFGQTNYSAAKAGMIGFSRALALELAGRGITVNCVCPGYVHTSMVAAIREDVLDGIIKQIPVGRLATAAEIADAVAFLAKKESAYITGTELAVNGGLWLG